MRYWTFDIENSIRRSSRLSNLQLIWLVRNRFFPVFRLDILRFFRKQVLTECFQDTQLVPWRLITQTHWRQQRVLFTVSCYCRSSVYGFVDECETVRQSRERKFATVELISRLWVHYADETLHQIQMQYFAKFWHPWTSYQLNFKTCRNRHKFYSLFARYQRSCH